MKANAKAIATRPREPSPQTFRSGGTVPRSGVYGIAHPHKLSGSAHLLQGHVFPSCSHCDSAVLFNLMAPLKYESASARFRLLMTK
jgi:hypothetical protein